MMHRALAALVVLSAALPDRSLVLGQPTTQQSCLDESKAVKCDNCDFKQDIQRIKDGDTGIKNGQAASGYAGGVVPTKWTCANGNCFTALNGNRAFQPSDTPRGLPFIGLFCRGHEASRKFTGLVPGKTYTVSFLAAERKGYGSTERMTVRANGVSIAEAFSPVAAWVRHTYPFSPNQNGDVTLEWINSSPPPLQGQKCGKECIFFTDVSIHMERDCGHDAGCFDPIPPATKFTCRCNAGGTYLGKPVVGGPANCTQRDSLPDRITGVEGQVGGVTKGVLELVAKVGGLQDGLASTDKTAAAQGETQGTAASDIADLKTRMGAVEGQLAALVAALKAGKAPESALAVAEEPRRFNGFEPSITAEEGGMDVALQQGRHLKVNGERVLTAEEVTTAIRDAVAGALVAVGDAA